MFAEWMRQLRTWLAGSRFDEELDEEMQFHRDRQERELREAGLTPAEAKRQANLSFTRSRQTGLGLTPQPCRREHSRPEQFHRLIEDLCPGSNKVELFARLRREG
jgi:hypothetical protein